MDMTNPGVQNPHCVPLLLTSRDCTSSRLSGVPTPSTVVMDQPSHFRSGVMHCREEIRVEWHPLGCENQECKFVFACLFTVCGHRMAHRKWK